MIRRCAEDDVHEMLLIINDAAQAYKGVIPADRWHEPYMPENELREEMADGVEFWGYEMDGRLVGVMGIQDRGKVTLIRHAYVETRQRNKGIGSMLLRHLMGLTGKPILIGTWLDATWAIRFYEKHGFHCLPHEDTTRLLKKYRRIPERQTATCVVPANQRPIEPSSPSSVRI